MDLLRAAAASPAKRSAANDRSPTPQVDRLQAPALTRLLETCATKREASGIAREVKRRSSRIVLVKQSGEMTGHPLGKPG